MKYDYQLYENFCSQVSRPEDNINTDLIQMEREEMHCINLAQNSDQCGELP